MEVHSPPGLAVPILQFEHVLGSVNVISQTDPSSFMRAHPQNDRCKLDSPLGKLNLPEHSGSEHSDNYVC